MSAAAVIITVFFNVLAMVIFIVVLIGVMVMKCGTGPPAGGQDSGQEHPLQERNIGDEEAAKQLVTSENEAIVLGLDGEEAPPTYDGRLSSQ